MGKVVGLIGLRGAGKDTVARFLIEEAGWKRAAFADALYQEVADAFGVTVEFLGNRDTKETPLPALSLKHCKDVEFIRVLQDLEKPTGFESPMARSKFFALPRSPRQILQFWGTEYRREVYRDDYWREQVRLHIQAHPGENFVITDVRFPDEARMVEALGGSLARVVRPGQAGSGDPALLHSSEQAMLNYDVPQVFLNTEGADGLANLRADVLAKYVEPEATSLGA